MLVSSGVRRVREADREYATWLTDLRAVCTAAGVPLILDEVYTGFRLAPRGAQDYFGVLALAVLAVLALVALRRGRRLTPASS